MVVILIFHYCSYVEYRIIRKYENIDKLFFNTKIIDFR